LASFFGDKDFFGLDIGSSAIRLVQLRQSGQKQSLVSYGQTSIPIGLSQSDSDMDVKQISQIIKKLVHETRVSTKSVVSALPGSSVYTVVVKMPQMSKDEIEKAVQWQAEQNIPLKLDEVKISWQLISSSVGPQKEMAVMIIAAPNTKIERMMKTLEGADLKVKSLETAPVALTRSLGVTAGAKVMIIDIGATNTEIAIVKDEVLYHSRTLPVASFAFTRAMSQNLGLDINQAEQFKRKFGLSQDKLEGEIFKTLQPLLTGIVEEVKRSLKFYQEQFGETIDKIIVSGGGARLPELSSYISSLMEIDVQVAQPWAGVSFPPSVQQDLINTYAEYSTAVGLAMRK
jgi:type IV pilus assembly protein PilM